MNPYAAKFAACEAPLRRAEEIFEQSASADGWQLLRNIHHHPSRSLRLGDNPRYAIELSMIGDWRIAIVSEAQLFEFSAGGWYENAEGIWYLSISYGKGIPADILPSLGSWIECAKQESATWTSAVIQERGRFMKHFTEGA